MKRSFMWGGIILLLVLLFTCAKMFGQTEEFKPSGKINSQVMVDYFYVVSSDTATYSKTALKNVALQGAENTNAFKVRRIFLGYEYNFSPKISTMVRMEADEASLTSEGKSAFFMKDAYIKWNILSGNTLIFGFQPTFSFELSEKYWGHRFIEKTHSDLRGIVASRELGVSLRGNVNDGKLRYNLMVGNNNSHKPESDRFKRIYGNIEFKPIENGPEVSVYTDYAFKDKKNGKNVNELHIGGFIGYKTEKFLAGTEVFYRISPNSYVLLPDTIALKALGISLFGTLNLTEKISAFGRFDVYNPNANSKAKGDSRNYITAGVDFKPVSNIIVSPNVVMETYEKYTTSAGDYKPKSSVWARLTFFWLIK